MLQSLEITEDDSLFMLRKEDTDVGYKKKEMLQKIYDLEKTNQGMKNASYIRSGSIENVLKDCQQKAIDIGTYLEMQGEYTCSIVRLLEDYCENIYLLSRNLNKRDICRKISKKIQRQLFQIADAIKYNLPDDRKEVVFFPYKASMWDSLESIYMAAKKEDNCDAYCVPIPYFDLNADHSLGQMHYEGEQYPKNIEITNWQLYNFEERKPDEIYIHNAYDNWNLVTSVHPRFYSDNLKNYTEKLVYVPYFIMGEIDPRNEYSIESKKHFCFLPGIINADKVIIESESVKRLYVNEYIKAAKINGLRGNHIDRSYLKQKFQALGSPKYDKVLRTKKEDLEIPEIWLKIIQKPDGNRKKIIFYNTGISALLQYNEKWIEKIEDVLKIFRKNQNEIALLWRPHPLIENTMKSMRPEILQRFQKIKNAYISEGWGIYDITADVNRAICLSDAYYGDNSSVVQLYQKTGGLVMIQNVEIINEVVANV